MAQTGAYTSIGRRQTMAALVGDVSALAGAVALIAVLAFVFRMRRYGSWIRSPRHRDDRLVFRGRDEGLPLSLGPDGLNVPPGLERQGQTALMRLRLRVRPIGWLVDPFIEIQDARGTYRQYFERGVRGLRYLDLSPAFRAEAGPLPRRIGLRGRGLRWAPEASLWLFAPAAVDGAGVFVLAPHPDDAEIAAFGMYENRSSWVVTVTAGEKGVADLAPVVPTDEAARWQAFLRVQDSLTVPQLGNVPPERCVNLVYPDGRLEAMFRDPGKRNRLACEETLPRSRLRARNRLEAFQRCGPDCSWSDLVSDLRSLLARARPDIVICPHPALEIHGDHVFATVAVAQALRDLPDQPRSVFLYAVHNQGAPTFPFGPSDALVGLPPWRREGWIAEALYSHLLTADARRAKYFAVEAMHDVRAHGQGAPRRPLELVRAIRREVGAYLAGLGLHPTTLLRRAPRPNEMYFVVSPEALFELVERVLSESGCPSAPDIARRGPPIEPPEGDRS